MTFHLVYHTENRYESPVVEGFYEWLVEPAANASQRVLSLKFSCSAREKPFIHTNLFGFRSQRLRVQGPFQSLEFTMEAWLEKSPMERVFSRLRAEDERLSLTSPGYFIDQHLFLNQTERTRLRPEQLAIFPRWPLGQSLSDYAQELTAFLHNHMRFDIGKTTVETTAQEALDGGHGVCQDFAHILLGVLRSQGIACRYVSGYLNQGGELLGAAAMHAWVEVLIPEAGWLGLDPANNLVAEVSHLTCSHGVDYGDCSPIRGILRASGGQESRYSVYVLPEVVEQ